MLFIELQRLDQVRQEALKVPSSTQKQVRELDARVHQLEQRLMVTALASDAVRREDHVHLAERLRRLAEATAQLRDEVENQGVTVGSHSFDFPIKLTHSIAQEHARCCRSAADCATGGTGLLQSAVDVTKRRAGRCTYEE